jgi:hypothetical protein
VISLVDERSGLLVVDVEQVMLEAVALRDARASVMTSVDSA